MTIPGRLVADHETREHAREQFEAFYRREFSSVVGLAYVLSGSSQAAEDLAQEGFLAAHRRWDEISRLDRPEAWVRRVVANLSASLVRRRMIEAKALVRLGSRRQPPLPDLGDDDAGYWRAVRALPKRQAQVVALYYLFDLSLAEVAATVGVAEGTVKAHLHKARRTLATTLGLDEEGNS